jgi:hypothetical protein
MFKEGDKVTSYKIIITAYRRAPVWFLRSFWLVLEFELRALHLLSKHSTT